MGRGKKTGRWVGTGGAVGKEILELNSRCLAAYERNPALVEEHANAERIQTEGGYGRRQVWELIQNGADELINRSGRVEVVLTDDYLYCANEGKPITPEGAGAILSAYRSSKRGPEIGRFGLGFKSVLGVSSKPEFFSQSGSFGFDPDFAAREIRKVTSEVEAPPVLRLALPLTLEENAAADSVLEELAAWATTVVRLPLDKVGAGDWLHDDLGDFPAEFLVFSPHISALVLDDRVRSRRREIQLRESGDSELVLAESGAEDRWRVFVDEFKPSSSASRDGGAMADREIIRFQWAVPVQSRQRTGRLWAYFPTLEETTLSGVLNAPWKLNDDRTRVIEGPFNREILEQAGKLVLGHLDALTDPDDPGNVLDILPARGRETRNWADGDITEMINENAPVYPSVPDQEGELDLPASLHLHPSGLPESALRMWSNAPSRPVDWAHPSIEANQTRRSRAERFFEAGQQTSESVASWLEALIPEVRPENAGIALRVAAAAVTANEALLTEVRDARIVINERDELATCAEVLLPGSTPLSTADINLVHPALAGDKKVREALLCLGCPEVDPRRELEAWLDQTGSPSSDREWDQLWSLVQRVQADEACACLAERGLGPNELEVWTCSGRRVRMVATLLPGEIAGPDEAPETVIDLKRHSGSLELLRRLGVRAGPEPGGGSLDEPVFADFNRSAIDAFLESVGAARPEKKLIKVRKKSLAGPVTPVRNLPDGPRARFTEALLQAQTDFKRWVVEHPNYKPVRVLNPLLEVIREHGTAPTPKGFADSTSWVGPGLREWVRLLPVVRMPEEAADELGLPETLGDLTDSHWKSALENLIETADLNLAVKFYSAACRIHPDRPDLLLARVGENVKAVASSEVRVASTLRHLELLARSGLPTLLVEDAPDLDDLVEAWGLIRADDEISSNLVAVETAPRVPLVDAFPALKVRLDESRRELVVARCSEILIETYTTEGKITEPSRFHIEGDVIYADAEISDTNLLRSLSERLGLDLDSELIEKILENKLSQAIRRRKSEARKAGSDAERLARLIEEEDLRSALPQSLLAVVESVQGTLDHLGLARMALATRGVDTVRSFRSHLEDLGFQPPTSWAGSPRTIEFVKSLGFGAEMAGFPGSRREAKLEVDGPPDFRELHEYQREVVDKIQELLTGKDGLRGLLSLPTGAGKTRVAIQALVEAMRQGRLSSPILWIAQRDELCEQAVQAWSEVWRAIGPGDRLTIGRLWAQNEAEEVKVGSHVVVATIDKLTSGVVESRDYKWLAKARCVVIDEAHAAITPQYTSVLEWQKMDRGKERAPLIGLTATPFRGTDEKETKRLIRRFGGRRLDSGVFDADDPYRELQDMGILSRVEHRVLDGSDLELTKDEVKRVKQTRLLPPTAAERLAADVKRNTVLLESVRSLPSDWTVLMFCASVEHAQVMAGLLAEADISAAAISADTPPAVRRHYVEAFRRQETRVLTNYAVLTAGFDAPKVRAVYVARPTYSPNLYQQMIGRGLRGPLNMGSEECLIVNVEDNIVNFGETLAFRQFEHLWNDKDR